MNVLSYILLHSKHDRTRPVETENNKDKKKKRERNSFVLPGQGWALDQSTKG